MSTLQETASRKPHPKIHTTASGAQSARAHEEKDESAPESAPVRGPSRGTLRGRLLPKLTSKIAMGGHSIEAQEVSVSRDKVMDVLNAKQRLSAENRRTILHVSLSLSQERDEYACITLCGEKCPGSASSSGSIWQSVCVKPWWKMMQWLGKGNFRMIAH